MKISKRQFLMSGAASAFSFWLPAGTAAAQSSPVQIGLFTRARGVSLPRGTSTVRTNGHGRTGRGAALYVADPAVDARYVADNPLTSFVDASGRGFRLSLDQQVTPFMAGASGDGDETLYATRYISDIAPGTPVSQATRDGLALNEIFRLMRRLGGGALHIPAGEFRTYGYLERIDFPLEIVGAGRDVAFIRNCRSSPTERDGYGILITLARRHTPFRITGVTLDGRAHERRSPGVGRELRNYPIAVNGRPQAVLSNCAFLNSPIDCMRTGYANGDANCWLRVDNCIFSNSFRNTISPVAGWNQQYTDCIIEKGGTVHGGTNPRYCIDVEPGQAHETIKNITFTNCTVREARNVVIGGVWAGNVRFVGCLIQAMGGSQWGPGEAAKPWFTNLRGGEFTFDRCRFEYLGPGFRGRLYLTNPIGAGEYARTQFVRLNGCRISGGGIDGYGLHMELNDVVVENSKRPVVFRGRGVQNVKVDGLRLVNVFDEDNAGAGHHAAFVVHQEVEGSADVQDVEVLVDPGRLPRGFNLAVRQQHGISIHPRAANGRARIRNLRASGYAESLPRLLGAAPDRLRFRDLK